MIEITVYKKSGKYRGFTCKGHAEYAEEGYDIICAAVSVLTVNTVNSVERYTDDGFHGSSDEGFLKFYLDGEASEKTELLLDSMVSGLQDIQRDYGSEYIGLIFKEE